MNTTQTPPEINAPAPDTRDGWRPLVAVRLSILYPIPHFFPGENYIAAVLLGDSFSEALISENLLEKDTAVQAGHFNDSWYLFSVTDATRALELLDAVLTRNNVRDFASLLFYHTKLLRFQPHGMDHAGVGLQFTLSEFRATLNSVHAKQQEVVKAMAILRAFKKSPPDGQQPDSPQAPA